VTFLAFVAVAVVFFVISRYRGGEAGAIAALPQCRAVVTHHCIVTYAARVTARYIDRRQQHILVRFRGSRSGNTLKADIQLSSDGWGGNWRGHFPVGEQVRIRYRWKTPLLVIEPDGHHRLTAASPASDSPFFWFMAWVFLGAAPVITLYVVWQFTSPSTRSPMTAG
jgi:hypothetical protein